MIPKIGLFDWSLALMYLFLIYFFAVVYKNKKIKTNPEYKYFLWGLTAKLAGGIGFVFYSIYIKQGGDSIYFHREALVLGSYLAENPLESFDLMFGSIDGMKIGRFAMTSSRDYSNMGIATWGIVRIVALGNMLSFGSYLVCSLLFSVVSFYYLWLGYSNLCRLYPSSTKMLLLPFFLMPTALLWSSGILKDTVTIGIVGVLLYSFSNIFIFKEKIFKSTIFIVVGSLVVMTLKPYLLYALLPCLLIWVQSNVVNLISGSLIKALVKPFLIIVLFTFGYSLMNVISSGAGKYKAENLENTLKGFHTWHTKLSGDGQSGYTLGEMEYTPMGIVAKIPASLNVTFFRPYLWEVRNLPTLLGAVEGVILLFSVLYLLLTLRLQFFKILIKNKEVFFMFTFAIMFGVIVGISSYNFGALSRYKIPASMLLVVSLILLNDTAKQQKTNMT